MACARAAAQYASLLRPTLVAVESSGRTVGFEPATAPRRPIRNLVANRSRHMLRYLPLSVLLALIAAPLPVRAEGPASSDVAAIDACLRKQDSKRGASQEAAEAACLMVVARPCMGDESAAADRRRIDCLDRERLVWEGIVAQSDAAMMKALEPEQQTKLRAMQQAWSHSRELSCGFWYDYFEGTMANPMIASCNYRETARRAIFLRIFAADLAGRK
ncbi:DUF1311 domain-containing protein [Rhodopseudomonas sp. P2A-2r]|uniref:lysozyme inhibitor LprI family protein n=1 Tax=Rhodopseudomonas sp. P2A-2r TaxID=2991972 RepID=UPI002233EE5A|nr:lysozyme inhibitor LprI family protein [Rhodopseudomonas sp. P2A-2r]UZE48762.1 DUF1311 domain-containing protein [Rhodopseudomonas sp. P2A-2r]